MFYTLDSLANHQFNNFLGNVSKLCKVTLKWADRWWCDNTFFFFQSLKWWLIIRVIFALGGLKRQDKFVVCLWIICSIWFKRQLHKIIITNLCRWAHNIYKDTIYIMCKDVIFRTITPQRRVGKETHRSQVFVYYLNYTGINAH